MRAQPITRTDHPGGHVPGVFTGVRGKVSWERISYLTPRTLAR